MHIAKLEQITIKEGRQRRTFDGDSMQELIDSIKDRGLLHAIICTQEGDNLVLVAGERRIKAITEIYMLKGNFKYNNETIPEGCIPYTLLGEMSELEAEEAEFDENFKREDLGWQEAADAHERLHRMRSKQMSHAVSLAETGVNIGVGEGATWTVADTAKELFGRGDGAYQSRVRKEIIVAQHLNDPDIAGAKSLNEGFKILKRKEELKKTSALADAIGLTFSAKDHKLYHADCLQWMKGKTEMFDVICTDPLYGMGADKFADAGGKMVAITHDYDDSYENWQQIMTEWCPLSYTICKNEAHAYVFCDFDRFHELKAMMQAAGWYVFRTPIICTKPGSGRVPLPEHGPRRQYELCMYAIKNKKTTTRIYPDVISALADPNDGHGAQKPVALYINLLQRSVKPGDHILDSFCGTGPIFGAAQVLKCYATGIELARDSYGLSLCRLQKLALED